MQGLHGVYARFAWGVCKICMRPKGTHEVGQLSAGGLHVVCVKFACGVNELCRVSDTCAAARVDAVRHNIYLVRLSHLANASGFYEVRQHKGGLLYPPLALQVLPLLAPVPGDRYTVTVCLHQPTVITPLRYAWISQQ